MIGYMDVFASLANPAADNFIIYDNIRVVEIAESDCNGNSVPDACEIIANGDFNADGQVNATDLAALVNCLSAPNAPPTPTQATCAWACQAAFDADTDGDVDLEDYADLQRLLVED
jgi:hypothetical protein